MTYFLLVILPLLIAPCVFLVALSGCVDNPPPIWVNNPEVATYKDAVMAEGAHLLGYWRLYESFPSGTKSSAGLPAASEVGPSAQYQAAAGAQPTAAPQLQDTNGPTNDKPQWTDKSDGTSRPIYKAPKFTDGYVDITAMLGPLNGLNPCVELWVKPDASTDPQTIFGSQGGKSGTPSGYQLDRVNGTTLYARVYPGNGQKPGATERDPFNDDRIGTLNPGWNHVVMWWERDSDPANGSTVRLFVNGAEQRGSTPSRDRAGYTPNSDGNSVRIGAGATIPTSSGPLTIYPFTGNIAEVAIYDGPLDPNKVAAHYNARM